MKSKKLTSVIVLMMSLIIMLGIFALPASAAKSLSKATVTYEKYYTYTGKSIKPSVTVKVGSKKLSTKSYTVSYQDNKAVGKGYIIIKGKGSYSGTVKKGFYIEPKAVSSLKATGYSTKVKLSWSKATGAKGYQVYLYEDGKWVKQPTTSKTSCTVTGLDSVTTYKFRVRPYAKVGSKSLYGEWKTVSKSTTIGKPTSVEFSDITETSATVKWNKIPGATSYRINYVNSDNGYSLTTTSTTESVTLKSLGKGATYKVKISALNSSKKITGNYSDVFTFKTAPEAVKITKAEITSDSCVNLAWSASKGASGYTVYYGKADSDGNVAKFSDGDNVAATYAKIGPFTTGNSYVFKVAAYSKTSAGVSYSEEAVTKAILIPVNVSKVTGFKASSVTRNSVALTWDRATNIDGYKLYKDGVLAKTIDDPKTTAYTFENLSEGMKYEFAISAFYKKLTEDKVYEGEKTTLSVSTGSGAVDSVYFSSKPGTMKPGETFTLGVTVLPADAADKTLIYKSSNTSVATINQDGLIKAISNGETKITIQSQSNSAITDSFDLTVESTSILATSISLPSEIVMYEGDLISLNPTFYPENVTNKGYTVTGTDYEYSYKAGIWPFQTTETDTCKFDRYISVSTNNLLKAKKATITPQTDEEFSFTVTVRTTDGSKKSATTRVKVVAKMIDLTYKGNDASPWYYGNTAKLTASLDDSISSTYSDSDIRFKSSNTSIATVASDGTVTCTGAGDVTITAYTSDNKYSGSYTFYVRSAVTVGKTFYSSCKAGETYPLEAAIRPSGSSDSIMYYSSDTDIATVTNTGKVTFLKPGKVMIAVSCSSDPYSYKQIWFTSDSFSAPSGSASQVLSRMKTTANSIKTLKNLPSVSRYDETITSSFATTSKELTPDDLQKIFSSELSPKTTYLAPALSSASDYTVLKGRFMDSVPVKGQSYIISTALADSDVKEAKITDNGDYFYEMKLTLKEESMPSLPASASSTRHGKVFDILTSDYINTYLSKINNSGKISIKYSSFAQRYHNSSLTLMVNKATGNVDKAVFDMNVDVSIKGLELKYGLITSTMDVSFKCNNIVTIEFSGY